MANLPPPAFTNTPNTGGNYGSYNSGLGAGGAAIGGGLGQLFAGLFGGNTNPADSAMPYLNQIPGAMSKYLNPYIQAGQGAMGTLQGQYSNLLNNPGQMVNQMGAGYQQSPGYQFQLQQGLNAANNSAAAGGMAGTPMAQTQAAGVASQLANQDYYNYLNNVQNLYGQGLQGEQGINQMGFNASNDMANNLAQALMSQANLAYAGQANQNQSQGGAFGSLFGGLGSLLGLFGG